MILFGSLPSYDDLCVFGCLCFPHNQRTKGDKFASRSRKCVFVGYPFGKKGWLLYDLDKKVFFACRDVHFYEDNFPYLENDPPTAVPLKTLEAESFVSDFSFVNEGGAPTSMTEAIDEPSSSSPSLTQFPSVSVDVALPSGNDPQDSPSVSADFLDSTLDRDMRTKIPSSKFRCFSHITRFLSSLRYAFSYSTLC